MIFFVDGTIPFTGVFLIQLEDRFGAAEADFVAGANIAIDVKRLAGIKVGMFETGKVGKIEVGVAVEDVFDAAFSKGYLRAVQEDATAKMDGDVGGGAKGGVEDAGAFDAIIGIGRQDDGIGEPVTFALDLGNVFEADEGDGGGSDNIGIPVDGGKTTLQRHILDVLGKHIGFVCGFEIDLVPIVGDDGTAEGKPFGGGGGGRGGC